MRALYPDSILVGLEDNNKICVYIYIEREICIYIYVYIYKHIYIYMFGSLISELGTSQFGVV